MQSLERKNVEKSAIGKDSSEVMKLGVGKKVQKWLSEKGSAKGARGAKTRTFLATYPNPLKIASSCPDF